ncbi:hypothetical protein, partial [Vibrio cholerae]|uniref:hypothetical protein n=1 Tax=Vibrio cholerae TaxID=666 RepID=UPI0030803F0E
EQLAIAQSSEAQTKADFEAQQARLTALSGYISVLESKEDETQAQRHLCIWQVAVVFMNCFVADFAKVMEHLEDVLINKRDF